jgi:hypothetical protein
MERNVRLSAKAYYNVNGYYPSVSELASHMGLNIEDIRDIYDMPKPTTDYEYLKYVEADDKDNAYMFIGGYPVSYSKILQYRRKYNA